MHKALTIAGSDSGGGAGIEADLKTFASFNVHGMAALTSVTAQNTRGVEAIKDLPASMVKKQIECVVDDIGVDAAKTGMLSNSRIIKTVASTLEKYEFPVVVDPVMIAKGGAHLLQEEAMDDMMNYIIPVATVITPNRYEAERISGMKIRRKEDARKAARKIAGMGAEAVIIKGGHMGRDATDILYHKGKFYEYRGKRIKGCTHGTGCSFSAAITANLALGKNLKESVEIAKKFITIAIEYGERIGHGHCPVNPAAWMGKNAERWRVYEELSNSIEILMEKNIVDLIPEVAMNFAYSLPCHYAKNEDDVAAIEGRIVRAGKKAKRGEVKFGASHHLARALLKAMEFDEDMRAVMNIRFDFSFIKKASKKMLVSFYDRREEPDEIKKKEGATLPWGIENAIRKVGKVPDVIYHEGDVGKEPMILIFGRNPDDVLSKFRWIAGL